MKDEPSNNELLNACLADIATPEFRDGLLDQVLRQARQRRVRRRRNQALLTVACMIAAFALFEPFSRKAGLQMVAKTNPLEVHSVPLEAAVIATTRPGGFDRVETSRTGLEVVETLPRKQLFESIGDPELFAMLGGRPAILIHHGALDAELVLINPDDRGGFVVR